jgi:signal transduction histidine kinase
MNSAGAGMVSGASEGPERSRGAIQPGLLPALRIYIVLSAIVPVLGWRWMDPVLGLHAAPFKVYRLIIVSFVLLMIYTTWPWCRERMGRAFLPVALIVKAAQPFVGTYLTLTEFVPRPLWDYFMLVSMVRLMLHSECIVILTAMQYELLWAISAASALCALSAVTAFLYVSRTGPLHSLSIAIIGTQLIVVTGTGLVIGLLVRSRRRQSAALDERNRKLAHYASVVEQLVITQERNRLARELHDTLAHSLTAIAVQIEAAQALSEAGDPAGQRLLGQALETTRGGLTEARRSLKALRAAPLDDLGLSLAIRDLAESVAARAGLKLVLHIGSHLENVAPEVEQCVYRVAQEAMTNVARHAKAASLQIVLARENGRLRLVVKDDGRGFDMTSVPDTRYGLQGLRERAESIGGILRVESEDDKGTTVTLEIAAGAQET